MTKPNFSVCCPLCQQTIQDLPIIPRRDQTHQQVSNNFSCSQMKHHSHDDIYWCTSCLTGFLWPMPDEVALLDAYQNTDDPTYLEEKEARYHTFEWALKQLNAYLPQGQLLDVGSYCGFFMDVASKAGYQTVGVEPSHWACNYANQSSLHQTHQGTLDSKMHEFLKQEYGAFDGVTAWDILEHLRYPLSFMEQVHQALKPEGIFAFCTLDIHNWWAQLLGSKWPWYMQPHLYYFTKAGLIEQLKQAGFEVLKTQAYHHIISGRYLLHKVESLWNRSIPLPGTLRDWASRFYIPFQFGDIILIIARKV